MIQSVRLRNFRSHADTEVQLAPFNVLVGPNGSGKTSVLNALHLVSQMCRRHFSSVFHGALDPTEVVRFGTRDFSINVRGSTPDWSLTLNAVAPADDASNERWSAMIVSEFDGVETERDAYATDPKLGNYGTPREITQLASSAVFLRLNARSIIEIAPMTRHPRIEFDGFGLAAVLATVALQEHELFQTIQTSLRRIVPSFQRLRIDQHASVKSAQSGYTVSFDFVDAKKVRASAVSEGTLLALTLVTLLHVAEIRPRLILLDDIEQALHPQAQWELISMIRRALADDDTLQVVASSHSPYLVDELALHEVLVCAVAQDGSSRIAPLSSHPRASEVKGVLSTGEFLGAEGESWVLGASA